MQCAHRELTKSLQSSSNPVNMIKKVFQMLSQDYTYRSCERDSLTSSFPLSWTNLILKTHCFKDKQTNWA